MEPRSISPAELATLLDGTGGIELIDVRTPAEYRAVHVVQARNVPLERLDPAALLAARNGAPKDPLYVICHSGSRGRKACGMLLEAGVPGVVNIEGGTAACVQAGLPVVRGKQTMSLERQVRIAAGSLVLAGVALGALVHPVGFGLAAFIGAGLVFAGLTDTCGMGMLLARAPWNRSSESASSCNAG